MILRAASEITAPSSFSTGMDFSTFKKTMENSVPLDVCCLQGILLLMVQKSEKKKQLILGKHPIIYGAFYIPGGAGFLASTVSSSSFMKHPTICVKQSNDSLTVPTLCQVKLLLHQDMHSKQSSLKPKRQWPPPKRSLR